MELIAFLITTHGALLYFIFDLRKDSNEKTKRINKIINKVTKDMSTEDVVTWWKEFNEGDK